MNDGYGNGPQERQERVQEAIGLGVPDRVPIWFQDMGFFPANYVGITYEELPYDDASQIFCRAAEGQGHG